MSRIKVLALTGAAIVATPAAAQDSAVRAAADAFGERVGIEQIGLYNEGQVRGFDLNASGAYRIDDAYFSRAAPLNDTVLAGVGVRVGVNAAKLAYPAPSGVVNYRLREPAARNALNVTGGYRDFGTQVLDMNGSWSDESGRFGLTGGAIWRPRARWSPGYTGEAVDLGVVARLRLADRQTVRAFASTYWREHDGDFAMKSMDGKAPPAPRSFHNYSPEGAGFEARNDNFGLLYDGEVAGWSINAAAFRSVWSAQRQDFTAVETRQDGSATATLYRNAPRDQTSDSGEIRLSRVVQTGDFGHLLSGSVRARRSEAELASTQMIALGTFTLATDPAIRADGPWSGSRGMDTVEQVTASTGYGLVWRDRLQIRLGAHRTRYEKDVLTVGGDRTQGSTETTLYNASAIWSFTPRTSVFGSWVTGLEESGVAPQTAANRNEVLDPVEAEQIEVGVRHALTRDLTLIAAVFDVSKPTPGFRADGSYGLVGSVSHRGVEGSLSGRLDDKTNVVLGAVYFDPEIEGPLVRSGIAGRKPAGISNFVASSSIERQLGDGWSADAQFQYWGARWANTANTLRMPAVPQLSLGVRRSFELGGRRAQFRAVASNVTAEKGYWASPSGLLWPIAPRTLRATLTLNLGPNG